MNHRIVGLAAVVVLVMPAFVTAQTHGSAAKPDLSGIWTNATVTPLERPKEFAGKEFLTKAEAAEFEKQAVYDANGDRRDGGAEADVVNSVRLILGSPTSFQNCAPPPGPMPA